MIRMSMALAGCLAWLPLSAAAQYTVTTPLASDSVPQLGAQYRTDNAKVFAAANKGDFVAAKKLQTPVLAFCDRLTADGRELVSVANASEYEAYVDTSHKDVPVEWVDMACPAAYKMSAFLYVEAKQPDEALAMLDKASAMAPYWAEPHAERGYLLNMLGRSPEALASYQQAQALTEKFDSNDYVAAVVLRGLGYTLIELGELDQAESIYQKSLEVDPGNPLAEKELTYIREQRAKRL